MRSGPRSVVLAFAGLLLAGAAWLTFAAGGEPEPAAPAGTAADAADRPADPGFASGAVEASVAGEDTVMPDGEPTGSREDGAIDEPDRGPRIAVQRGEPREAVAGAVVYFVTASEAEQRRTPLPARNTEWPEKVGRRTTTGPDGTAELPPTAEPYLCAAIAGDDFAFAVVPPGRRTVTLLLQRDEQLDLLVTGPDDTAVAKAPFALVQQARPDAEAAVIWRGETERDGRARVRHFQLVRRGDADPAAERFAAVLDIACAPPVLAQFTGRPAQGDPVHLVMPPTGSADVVLTDHGGRPLLSPAVVFAAAVPPPDMPQALPLPRGLGLVRAEKPAGDVPVALDWLARDAALRVMAQYPNVRRGAATAPVAMPAAAGERARITLAPRPELAVVAGRLVVEGGGPLAAQSLGAVLWRGFDPAGQWQLTTTEDGRFDAVVPPPENGLLTLEIHVDQGAGDEVRRLGVRRDFNPPGAGQRCELGELVLVDLDIVCRGVVVDDRGEPVAGAVVTAQRARFAAVDEPRGRRNGRGENAALPQQLPQPTWEDVPLLRATAGDDGAFALFGKMPGGDLRVRADSPHHLADAVAWTAVAQELRIAIARNGVLRGRVLLPPWLPPGCAALTLRPFDETLRQRGTRRVDLGRRGGGRFTVEPLLRGRYDALVTLRGLAEPVCTLQDVFIEPGENRDERLRALDLRSSVFRYRLRAVDYAGSTMAIDSPLLLRSRAADGSVRDQGFRWRKGRAEFFTQSGFVDLVSFAPGCEPCALSLAAGDHDVSMRQLVPARLVLPGARALCGPDRRVRVSVILVGDSGYPQWLNGTDQRSGESFSFPRWELGKSNGAWLGASDLVEVPIVKAGRYEVILRVHATGSERSPQASVPLGEHELQIDGSAGPVTIPLDAQKLQEALARFAAAPQGR